jgi:hypothetical protein
LRKLCLFKIKIKCHVIRVTKSRRFKWSEKVVVSGDEKYVSTKLCSEICKGRGYLRDVEVDGRIKLKWILAKHCVKVWTGFFWLSFGASGGLS